MKHNNCYIYPKTVREAIDNCYIYPKTVREAIDGVRHYDTGKEKLPSVTTILSATQSEEKKKSLADWATRIGEEAAEKIKNEAAIRGTAMHKILEKYVKLDRMLTTWLLEL
jgi:genome maintenance exonuclease 1